MHICETWGYGGPAVYLLEKNLHSSESAQIELKLFKGQLYVCMCVYIHAYFSFLTYVFLFSNLEYKIKATFLESFK